VIPPNLVDSFTNIPDYGRPDPYRRSHFVHNAAAIFTSVWTVTDDVPEGLPGLLTKAAITPTPSHECDGDISTVIIKKLPWRNRTWARSASWWGGLFFFLCGLSLERLLLNDPLDQSLHFAILAVLGEFPLLCHAHSLPQTQQSDHLRPPVCTVANTRRFLLSAKGGSRLNGAAWCIPVSRAHDKKRPLTLV
jgi:hypothetical protein